MQMRAFEENKERGWESVEGKKEERDETYWLVPYQYETHRSDTQNETKP